MATPKIIADFESQISVAIAIGGTTFTISGLVDDDGVALPSGFYYFTIDNGSSNKEYLAGDFVAGVVTNVVSVSRQGIETSGAVRAHRVGASVVLTDFATYKKYMDSISLAGTTNATQSSQGVVEIATAAEIDADTATGGSGAPIVVAPDQLVLSKYGTRLPTATEKANLAYLASYTGAVIPFARKSAPSGFLLCDGTAYNRTTYADLFTALCRAATFTVTIASPGVFSKTEHGFVAGDIVHFTTTGALPTGLAINTNYYVITAGLTADAFEVSASRGGAAINTTGSQSGVHTVYDSNYGKGDGSTTFNVPDMRGYTPFGYKSSDANFDVLNVPNTYVGEKTHVLTIGELAAHTHTADQNALSPDNNAFAVGTSTAIGTSGLTTSSVGSDAAHNNMPPYAVFNFFIKI
jgi:microcystin-dependent protein